MEDEMGLDIRAYSQVELIETTDLDTWEEKCYPAESGPYGRETIYIYGPNDAGFEEHLSGIQVYGVYGYADEFEFRAGSYGGYNEWRDWLSRSFLGVPARAVWENREKYRGEPFFYLINFSDCEGIIAGVAAKKLAKDFANHKLRALNVPRSDDWFINKYNDWRKAFALASDHGLVEFC
jgi:hypothetical protein